MDAKVSKSDAEWREELIPERFHVLREAGTEPPFTGAYMYSKADGMYRCGACGAELFSSDTKFDSGTGWPSFTEPAVAEAVELREDNSPAMVRTEVMCARCGSHLGHVFPDGPGPGGQRYCINSLSLDLDERRLGRTPRLRITARPEVGDLVDAEDRPGEARAGRTADRARTAARRSPSRRRSARASGRRRSSPFSIAVSLTSLGTVKRSLA